MEIKVLGSGSSGNCYVVDDGGSKLMLEAGLRYKELQRGLNFQVSSLAGCLVSHEHGDHSKAVKDLLKAGVDVYASYGTVRALGIEGHHRVRPMLPYKTYTVPGWSFMGLPVKHDCEEPFAFVAANEAGERLLYLTDSMYSPFRFKGLTTIMVECNYALDIIRENVADGVIDREHKNRVIRSHMSLDTVKGLLTANDLSKVEAIYLLHLSNDNSDEERFKREIQELTGKPVYVA